MKRTKRFLSGLLAVALACTMLPMTVFATDSEYCYDEENKVGSCRLTAQATTDGVLADETGGTVYRKNTDAKKFDCCSGVWTFGVITNPGYKFVGWENSLSWERKVAGHFENWKWVHEYWYSITKTNPEKIRNNCIDDHIDNKNGNYAFHAAGTHMGVHHVGCSVQSAAFIRNVHYNIIAKFESDNSVTFNSNGGSAVNKIEKIKPNTIIPAPIPAAPTKGGYNFMGWFKEPSLENKWDFDTDKVNGHITLYAKWSVANKTYGVYHYSPYAQPGSTYDTQFINEKFDKSELTEADIRKLVNEVKYGVYEGYDLWGYKPNDSKQHHIAIKGDSLNIKDSYDVSDFKCLALHLSYNKDQITHTVTFDSNGGSTVKPVTGIRNKRTITAPTEPKKDGYKFMGWYKEPTLQNKWDFDTDTVKTSITLYAKWNYSNKTYGVYHYSPYAKDGEYDTQFANDKFGKSVLTEDNIKDLVKESAYGVYEGFELWGYKPNDSTQYQIAAKYGPLTLATSYDVSDFKEMRLHIVYNKDKITHTVRFNSNGGSTVSPVNDIRNKAKIKAPQTPTKPDCILMGWFKDTGLQDEWHFKTDIVTSDITLYAKWNYTNRTYGVYHYSPYANKERTYDTQFINQPFSNSVITEDDIRKLVDEVKYGVYEGYDLWGYKPNDSKQHHIAIKGDSLNIKDSYDVSDFKYLALHLSYNKDNFTYTVTFDSNGGSTVKQVNDIRGSTTIPEPEVPTKDGYEFKGWYKEPSLENEWKFGEDKVKSNIILYAKWSRDEKLFTNYTVEYYKDSIAKENMLETPVDMGQIKIGTNVELTNEQKNLRKPLIGYLSGTVQNASTTITATNNIIKVLYVIDNKTKLSYSVSYYINGTIVPNLEYYGSVPLAKPIVNSGDLRGEGSGGLHGQYLKGCLFEKTIPATPFEVTANNVNIGVYYNTTTTDVIPVTHNYYLNNSLQSSTTNNEPLPSQLQEFNTTQWQKPINGYSFSGISIKRVLKDMFVEIKAFNLKLKGLQSELDAEKAKVENADGLLAEYNALFAKLNQKPAKVEDKVEAILPPVDQTLPNVEAILPPVGKVLPKEENKSTTSTATVTMAEENVIPVDDKAKLAEIEARISTILELQKQIDAVMLEKATAEAELNQEMMSFDSNTPLPKEETTTGLIFNYDPRYIYTVTINYSQTTSSGNTENNNNNNSRSNNNVYIPEEEVPLAKVPDDIVTIVDKSVPLGKLPKAGGLQAPAIGGIAFMALIASFLLKLKKRED